MATPVRKHATYDDLPKVPGDEIAEIVGGDLYASPRPSAPYSGCAFELSVELGGPFGRGRGGPGGWLFLFEPEMHLEEDTLSPSTERLDRVRKLPAYCRHGVGHAWLVNPGQRTLEVLRREAERRVLLATLADDARVRAEPFDAIEIDLLGLWGEQRPPEGE